MLDTFTPAHPGPMSGRLFADADASVISRMRAEFAEMPGLCLTREQARRLWNLPAEACQRALDHLVEAGYLTTSARGSYQRPSAVL